jgi:hypothetical protein
VFGAFRAGGTTIFLKGESTHIVLENYVLLDCVALGFKEITCPKDVTSLVIDSN